MWVQENGAVAVAGGAMGTEAMAVRGWETQSCFSEASEYMCVALCWVGDKSQRLKALTF